MSQAQATFATSRKKGITLVIIGAMMWGVSGPIAQFLFQKQEVSPEWLTVIRLLISGCVFLGYSYTKEKQEVWRVWQNKSDIIGIVLFGILGMLAVQYTYFAAIHHGNAATATVLQYLAPIMITCYVAIITKKMPNRYVRIAVLLALSGTFLLVTGGSIYTLSISGWALFWGIASAVALAFYTLQPLKLLAEYGSPIIVGWGMIIGGICFCFVHPPWKFVGQWSVAMVAAVIFIIVFGTIVAFYCYLESLKHINPSEASILASVEPLSAMLLSIIWLNVVFGIAEWIGSICIISTVMILSLVKNKS